MILKRYVDLDMKTREEYTRLRWQCEHKLLRDVTLMYNYRDHEDGILFAGVISPFVAAPSLIELAMLCGYWDRFNGGEVRVDNTGGFQVFMYNKGVIQEGN